MTAPSLPAGVTRVTVVTLVLVALVGYGSMAEVVEMILRGEPDAARLAAYGEYRDALKASVLASLAAYEAMRGSRLLILILSYLVSTFVLMGALRLLRPGSVPRDGIRRALAGGLLVSAVLRVLDGAQAAAVARKAGRALDRALAERPELVQSPWPIESVAFALSVAFTFAISAALLMLSRYYRRVSVEALKGSASDGGGASA